MCPNPNSTIPLPLPTEITAEIFKHTVSVDIDALSQETAADGLTTPLVLAAVCRSWRNFVCDAPFLWRCIVMNVSKRRYNAQLNILEIWLKNSGDNPLEIWFNVMNDSVTPSVNWDVVNWQLNPPLAAIRKLMDHSERWERINLCVFYDFKYQFLDALNEIKGRIPRLRAAHVRPIGNGAIERRGIDIFNDAPLLESFSIYVLFVEDFPLPWTQLTSFRARLPWDECLTVLRRCINLEECTFYAMFDNSDSITSVDMFIIMPRLRSLNITNTKEHLIKTVIQRITCPALRHIRLSIFGPTDTPYPMDLPFYEIENLLTRSQSVLENLNLASYSIPSSDQVFRILEATPSLHTLTLRSEMQSFSDMFFDALIENLDPSKHPAFLPRLTHIQYFTQSPILDLVYHRLAKVIKQRQQPVDGTLKLLELLVEAPDETQDMLVISDELKELAKRGMKITIQGLTL